uniref:Mediator of RNA polymerase II transcription subunit 4 n=1 Tax=Strongyloides stercoralis TaxID=6248 RepID=A0A0K0E3V6_STRER
MDSKIIKTYKNDPINSTISFSEAIDITTKRVTTMHEKLVAFTNSVNDNENIDEQIKKFIELHRNYKKIRRLCLLINKSSSIAEEQKEMLNDLQRRLDLKRDLLDRLNEIPNKLKQVTPGENVIVPERKTYTIEVDDIPLSEKNDKLILGSELEQKKEEVIQKLLKLRKNEEVIEGGGSTIGIQGSTTANLRDLLSNSSK